MAEFDKVYNRRLIHFYNLRYIYTKSDVKTERDYANYLTAFFGDGHWGGKANFSARKKAKQLPLTLEEYITIGR